MNMAPHEDPMAEQEKDPSLPFPIFRISSKIDQYLLYDINIITWLRRTHNILGVLIGTLPQFPQQNVFLGLPLELQPEEARLLVEKDIAYVVSDLEWHERGSRLVTSKQRREFLEGLRDEGREVARVSDLRKEVSREKTMKHLQARKRGTPPGRGGRGDSAADEEISPEANNEEGQEEEETLFESSPLPTSSTVKLPSSSAQPLTSSDPSAAWTITPTTSYPPLPRPPLDPAIQLPAVRPSSYALFKHLHAKSYFISPGLRFGCQFLVYPGDPLRFHSHFLAVGLDWDEEFDLLDLVGGGRLGTGVKKGWLVGGVEREGNGDYEGKTGAGAGVGVGGEGEGSGELKQESGFEGDEPRLDAEQASKTKSTNASTKQNTSAKEPQVRTFCLEWGGM